MTINSKPKPIEYIDCEFGNKRLKNYKSRDNVNF